MIPERIIFVSRGITIIKFVFVLLQMKHLKPLKPRPGYFLVCHSVLQLRILVKLVGFLHCSAIKILKTFKKSKKPGHFYKLKKPARAEMFGSKKRTRPGKRGGIVAVRSVKLFCRFFSILRRKGSECNSNDGAVCNLARQ